MINKEEILRKAKKNSSRKRRLSLIFSLPVSLLSVFTAAVSTFAWYQASSASIEISGESTTTISVAAPDSVAVTTTLYKYKAGLYTGSISSSATIASNFSTYTGNQTISGAYPGSKMTFAIKVHASAPFNYVTLKLKSYAHSNVSSRKVLNSSHTAVDTLESGDDKLLKFDEAINIFGKVQTSSTYGTANTSDVFDYDYDDESLTPNLQIAKNASSFSGVTDAYVFYTICFDNDPSTYYQEFKYENSTYSVQYSTPSNDSNDRYFYQTTSGNSTCYEGCSFSITQLEISLA